MILQADEIIKRLKGEGVHSADPLVIAPRPDHGDLARHGAASVDLRLGTWFATPRARKTSLLDIQQESEVSLSESRITKKFYVGFGDHFVLHPGAFVLAMTLEWIRLPKDLAGYVTGRSLWGRRGLIIETAMGIHPGFAGCLTLELANVGEVPIAVRPGVRACQVFFHETTAAPGPIDRSRFVGYGRPILGRLQLDPVATKLCG